MKSYSDSPIVPIGDSFVKNINPKKISKKKVIKRTFPGKCAEETEHQIKSFTTDSTPSHVITYAGTNNLSINTAQECVKNIEDLAHSAKERFPGSRITMSSTTGRHDIDTTSKILEVKKVLRFSVSSMTMILLTTKISTNHV